MADKAFRILLDCTDLYLENFKYVWINVSPRELKTISDLKKYVLRKINLERDVELFVRDGLLLDEETITILREDDTVKIKYKTLVHQNLEKGLRKSASFSKKRNLSENTVSDEDISLKRHKPEIVTLSSNGNEDTFPEKKSKKEKGKKQTKVPTSPEKVFSTSILKSKTKKVPVNSENFCCTSVKKVTEQTELSENFENNHSDLIEENQTQKKKKGKSSIIHDQSFCCTSVKKVMEQTELSENFENNHSDLIEENQAQKKKKGKSSIIHDQNISGINLCKSNHLFYSFNTQFIPEKQKENKKSSKTVSSETKKYSVIIKENKKSSKTVSSETEKYPVVIKENKKSLKTVSSETEKYPVAILSNSSSSKEEEEKLSFHENESSSVAVDDFNSEELNDKNLSKTKKRKRKRSRKRKKSAVLDEDNYDVNIIDNSKSFLENVDENINRKHILYLSPDTNQEVSCLNDAHEIHNPIQKIQNTFVLNEDKFPIIPLDYPKMSTPAQSNSRAVPNWQLSLMPIKNSNLSYNGNDSTLHDESEIKNITSQSNKNNNSDDLLYEGLPDMTSLPDVGTCIAYKVLELSENYSPVVTNYREGVIERINPDADEIKIRLNKEIILPGKSGKFENLKKDEVPEPIVKTHEVLKWSDIISPKFLGYLPE